MTGNEKHITYCKKKLGKKFNMKDGFMYYFLRLEVAKPKMNIFELGKVCSGDTENI